MRKDSTMKDSTKKELTAILSGILRVQAALVCIAFLMASPVLAKKHSERSGYQTVSGIVESEGTETGTESNHSEMDGSCSKMNSNKADWKNGTWVNGCYVNDRGEVMASLSAADQEPLLSIRKMKRYDILFLGASQTTRTEDAIKDKKVFFYGCSGARFDWFFLRKQKNRSFHPAYQVIRAFIRLHPRGTVVVDMGGNDIDNVEAYVGFYRDLIQKYPRVRFFFRGVPPREIGDPENGKRLEFNRTLERAIPGHVINLFEEIYALPDIHTLDGAHYAKPVTRKIYQMTMDAIGRNVKVNERTGRVTKDRKTGRMKKAGKTDRVKKDGTPG